MKKIWTFKRVMAVFLAVLSTWMSAERAAAMLAPAAMSQAAVSVERTHDLKTVQTFLERKQVRQRLVDYGLTDEQVQSRLGNLSDQQLHQVATRIDKQNPAADGGGFIITILLIGVLVLLFVYLLKRV